MTTSTRRSPRIARRCAAFQSAVLVAIGGLAGLYAVAAWLHDRHSHDEWAGLGEAIGLYVAFLAGTAAVVLGVLAWLCPQHVALRILLLLLEGLTVMACLGIAGGAARNGPVTVLVWALIAVPAVAALLDLGGDLVPGRWRR